MSEIRGKPMIYTDGTIAIKAGSPIVTGTGTQWKKNIHGVAPGQLISIENGTAPVSMMIRAVNSDTELVLSFNAPVTLSGAKYSIATTVPDTISDAARTMSANQGYIVYFLQAMQQWMTDTGQVEIELPNGQKVTLENVKALNEAISKIPKVVQGTGTSTTNVMSQDASTKTFQPKGDYATNTALNGKLNKTGGTITGVLTTTGNITSNGDVIQVINSKNNQAIQLDVTNNEVVRINSRISSGTMINHLFPKKSGTLYSTGNTTVDSNGNLKIASPIVKVFADHIETNDESEGAEVRRTGTGQYHITGILGYNSDGAWGVNGGVSVPKDNNGLELVYVDDRVQEDGSLIIETCHRQHAHLPERFQNWRLKEVTPEGERIFYQDGEPCDLPESTRLDVRVEMPQGSVWNVKQRELAEQMEREQAEREAQENN
ncbi:hypothetical protein ABN070_03910 [Morganella morganii]